MNLFEIVNTTNEDVYFTLAVYDDFETAKSELLKRDNDKKSAITDTENGDYEIIEIRQRKIGWDGECKVIFTLIRSKKYNDGSEEYEWLSKYVDLASVNK